MKIQYQKGMTLVELLMYILLTAIIVVIAGQTFVDTAKFSFRTKNLTGAGMEANEALVYMSEDIARTGAKRWLSDSASLPVSWVYMDTNIATVDSSSFTLIQNNPNQYDQFKLKVANYSDKGVLSSLERVEYFVVLGAGAGGDTLKRNRFVYNVSFASSSMAIASSASSTTTEILATNVSQFKIELGATTLLSADTLFVDSLNNSTSFTAIPSATLSKNGGLVQINKWSLGGNSSASSAQNRYLVVNTPTSVSAGSSAAGTSFSVNLKVGEIYQLQFKTLFPESFNSKFKLYNSTTSSSDKDILEARLISNSDTSALTSIPKYFYYPGNSLENVRKFDFSPTTNTVARLVFVFSTQHAGWNEIEDALNIGSVTLLRLNKGEYTWISGTGTNIQKMQTKALRLNFTIQKGGQSRPFTRIITIPNNGI